MHPVEQDAHPAHGHGMGQAHVLEQLRHPLEASAALAVVHALGDEGIEVQVLGRLTGGDRHERAADRRGVARHDRGGAVAGELGRAEPLEEGVLDREQRQPGQERQPHRPADPEQDQQRGLVQDVVRVDVSRFVGEHHPPPVVVEDPDQLGVEQHDRLGGADRVRVRERELGQVEIRHALDVERVEDLPVEHPDARQLLLAEPDRGAQRGRAERALVAERDELPHHLVEIGHLLKRRGRGAVGRMLIRPRRDPLELPGALEMLHVATLSP